MDEEQFNPNEAIHNYYQSEEYHKLKALSERKTLLDIFRKSRSETIHSNMIAWCFDNEEFKRTPEPSILFLLRLAAIKADRQNNEIKNGNRDDLISNDLWKIICTNGIKDIEVEEVNLEESVKNNSNSGRSDIAIKCTINKKDKVRILIENKVDSKEHDGQCEKYVEYYEGDGKQGYKTIYLFLAPDEPEELSSDKFIKITYQEFLDSVLYPMLSYKGADYYSPRTVVYLEEYINTITSFKLDKKTNRILAMSKNVKELLKDFFNNNRDLILAAIECASEDDEALKEKAAAVRSGTTKYVLTLPDSQSPVQVDGHTKLAYRIAQYLANKYDKLTLLTKYKTLNGTTCSDNNFILDEDKKGSTGRKLYTGDPIACADKNVVWCSNQWIPDKVEKLKEALKEESIDIQ